MTSKDIINKTKKYVANTYSRFNIAIEKGKGSLCYDFEGNEYIDFTSGIGVNSLGFCEQSWVDAVSFQSSILNHTSNLYYSAPGAELAEKLCTKTGYDKVFFANSGAEANECAIKLARKRSFLKYGENRYKIITLQNSFHGRTVTTLSATGQDSFHKYFSPFTEGFEYVPANDIRALEKAIDKSVCAFMCELIQGEGGVIPLDLDYVKKAEQLCRKNDLTFIVDEVQTGIGRTGALLASEQFGVFPDITTIAKGLGGGLPIGACLMKDTCSNVLEPKDHATTFGMNPVVCAGANVVMDAMTDEFLNEVKEKSKLICKTLESLDNIKSVDGLGLMLGLSLKNKKAIDVACECNDNGLLILTAKEKLRLLPPLNISFDKLKKGLDILCEIISE